MTVAVSPYLQRPTRTLEQALHGRLQRLRCRRAMILEAYRLKPYQRHGALGDIDREIEAVTEELCAADRENG